MSRFLWSPSVATGVTFTGSAARRRRPIRQVALLFTALFLLLPATPARAGAPGWIVSCQASHQAPDDPIVSPGAPGAAHLHVFYGSRDTNAFSTPDSLKAMGTTCAMPGDTSAYWLPAIFARGQQLAPGTSKHALFYYRRIAAQGRTTVRTIPDGLRFIVGNANAQSPADNPTLGNHIIWKCGPGSGKNLPHPPTQCKSGVMVVSFRAPNCWDGVNLDSHNHRSHMAYPSGSRCPDSHPVVLQRVESFFRFAVGTAPIGEVTLSSGPWWTVHSDVFFAWVPSELQRFTDGCVNALRDCRKNPQ
jgi:uncharacterized protein DUF1996